LGQTNGSVMKRSLAGGMAAPIATNQAAPIALFVSKGVVYWASAGGTGLWIAGGGGAPVPLLSPKDPMAGAPLLALSGDATHLYFADATRIAMLDLQTSGSMSVVLSSVESNPVSIRLDGSTLFWLNEGTFGNNFTDGQIRSLVVTDATPNPQTVGYTQSQSLSLAVTPTALYFTTTSALFSIPRP
jgi:hypothetical protein